MSKTSAEYVGIVGGGLGGLAAACTLAARGRRVILFERNAWLGGKAAVLRRDGFRFDMGPTILTMPRVLRRIFGEAGRKLEKALSLTRLNPQWRCFFDDGSRLDLVENAEAMAASLAAFAPEAEYGPFMAASERLAGISEDYFFWKPVGRIRDAISWSQAARPKGVSALLNMRMGRTVSEVVQRFLKDGRVRQMAEHFTQYVGSSPMKSPAILCGIAHMQTEEGVWYPRGGTRAVPEALRELALDLGVEFRRETSVTRILVENGRASGVEAEGGERVALAAVVSNCDSVRTHRELLEARAGATVPETPRLRTGLFGRGAVPGAEPAV